MAEKYQPIIVALLDKPSTESFGMTGLIVKIDDFSKIYRTTGLAPRNRMVTPYELHDQLRGHILDVQSLLPADLVNPIALWLGSNFYAKAIALHAPPLPVIDKNWHQPLEPNEAMGKYTIKEPQKAYKILEDWVNEAAREALVRDSYDLAVLTRWTLPMHPATKAALYYTPKTALQQSHELNWQLRTDKRSAEQLIQEHERVRSELLEKKV